MCFSDIPNQHLFHTNMFTDLHRSAGEYKSELLRSSVSVKVSRPDDCLCYRYRTWPITGYIPSFRRLPRCHARERDRQAGRHPLPSRVRLRPPRPRRRHRPVRHHPQHPPTQQVNRVRISVSLAWYRPLTAHHQSPAAPTCRIVRSARRGACGSCMPRAVPL